jgi:AcrR family transcriptional regulator
VKGKIISTALDLFAQYGIKRVSMDDIACSAGISKRTLYEYFADKEDLLVEGLKYAHRQLAEHLHQIEKGDYTALDIFILIYAEIMKNPRWYSLKFYEDLKKYPRAQEEVETGKNSYIKKCIYLFDRGVKEGVFRKEVNFEIVALLFEEQAQMLQPSKTFCRYSNREVYDTVLTIFLHGISTGKGRQILDSWEMKNKMIYTKA